MSIINDALKKAQLNLKKAEPPPPPEEKPVTPTPSKEPSTLNVYEKLYQRQAAKQGIAAPGKTISKTPPEQKPSTLKSAKKWLKVTATIAICVLFVTGSLIFISRLEPVQDFLKSKKKPKFPKQTIMARKPSRQRTYRRGELILNGTSLIDGKRVALINDEIYEVGEIVDGKTITSINLNQIKLGNEKEVITLRVH